MKTARGGRWLAWLPLLYLVVFVAIPSGIVASYSFLERDYSGQVLHQGSLEAWREATDAITLRILVRSLSLALGVTVACLVLGFPCALALAGIPRTWRNVCVALIGFPLVTSLLLRVYGWLNLLPLEWRGTTWTVGLVMTVNYLPFMVLPLLRAVERSDANLSLAAMDLGANPWQTFWYVTLPVTRSGAYAGCALVFIPACGEYLVPHFVGEGKVAVLGTLIVQEFEHRNWPYAAAVAVWLLAIVTLPLVLSLLRGTTPATPLARADSHD